MLSRTSVDGLLNMFQLCRASKASSAFSLSMSSLGRDMICPFWSSLMVMFSSSLVSSWTSMALGLDRTTRFRKALRSPTSGRFALGSSALFFLFVLKVVFSPLFGVADFEPCLVLGSPADPDPFAERTAEVENAAAGAVRSIEDCVEAMAMPFWALGRARHRQQALEAIAAANG